MRSLYAVAVVILTSGLANAQSSLPDPKRTPGSLNPAVTQETIGQTICAPGWTQKIRPSTSVTTTLKKKQIDEFYGGGKLADFTEDHLIPLEIGGAPRDPLNLWPEPLTSADGWKAHDKDALENQLRRMVCLHQVPLATAQEAFANDWQAAYRQYVAKCH